MSARSIEFIENWIQKNVTATAKGSDNMRALVLANHCIAEVDALLGAESMGRYFNANIRGSGSDRPFDCRTHRVPEY
jgi:hypothetical protein